MGRQRELLRLSIILCMGLLFVMAGILLIVGKLTGKRPSSIAGGVLMIAWGASLRHPRITVVDARTRHRPRTHTGGHVGGARWRRPDDDIDRRIVRNIGGPGPDARGRIVLALGRSRASLPELREPQKAPNPTSDRTWMPGIPCAVAWPVFRCQSCGFVEKGHSREGK